MPGNGNGNKRLTNSQTNHSESPKRHIFMQNIMRSSCQRYSKRVLHLTAAVVPLVVVNRFQTDLNQSINGFEESLVADFRFKDLFKCFGKKEPPRDSDIQRELTNQLEALNTTTDPSERKKAISRCLKYVNQNEKAVFQHGRTQIISGLVNNHLDFVLALLKKYPQARKMVDPHKTFRSPRSPIDGQVHYPTLVLKALQRIKFRAASEQNPASERTISDAVKSALDILKLVDRADPQAFDVLGEIQKEIRGGQTVSANRSAAYNYIIGVEDPALSKVTDFIKARIAKGLSPRRRFLDFFRRRRINEELTS